MFSAKQLVLCIKQTHWKRPWCWERLRAGERGAEDEMIRKHHQLDGHEFNQTLDDSEGQKSLVSYSPCGRKDSDKTERLNNNLFYKLGFYILEWNLWCGSTFKSSKDTRTTPCQFLRVLHQKNKTWRIMNGFSPCEWVHSFSFMIETVATVITSSINN